MQIMKLAAIALFGVTVVGFSTMTSTGCSSTTETCDPELEECGLAGDAGSGGTAGTGGSGGSAGTGMAGSAGSGATSGSDSATKLATALAAGNTCASCLDGLSASVNDAGGQSYNCAGVATACDNDQACVNLVATADKERTSKPDSTPTCWLGKANEVVAETASDTSDRFYACVVFSACASSCGNLTNNTEACQ